MLKEEIISIIKETGFTGENVEEIVDVCVGEVISQEKL